MNLFKIFKRKNNDELFIATDRALADHIIALARLTFIKPERLVEEAKNVQANADYLLKMTQSGKPEPVKSK